jgi:two-component system nitrogen regulation sensor histidine kinase GlnL
MSSVKNQKQAKADTAANVLAAPLSAALLQALPDAVLAVQQGHVCFVNEAALGFLGMGEKAVIGQSLPGLFGDAHAVCAAAEAVTQGGQGVTMRDIELAGRPVGALTVQSLPDVPGLYMVCWRVEKISFGNEWLTQQRNALKPAQHMARTLAHEIKNPLAGIRGAAQLLHKSASSEDDQALAALIDTETQRILRLVERMNVFDIAALEKMQPVNLHDVTGHVADCARAGFAQNCTVHEVYDPSLPDVSGDRDALVQAVMNLVKNGAESGADTVWLRTSYAVAPDYHPETGQRLPIILSIEDNGPGMSAEAAARLFEPCFTTKPQGEGLGLVVVSRIVDAHGGMIGVSRTAERTVFKLSFPAPPRRKEV